MATHSPSGARAWAAACLLCAAIIPVSALAQDRFLGTGGGNWLLAADRDTVGVAPGLRTRFEPVRCGNVLCELDLQIAEPAPTTDAGAHAQRVLYRSRFAVRATGNLPGCRQVAGIVDGALIDLGTCGRGAFVGPNEVHLRLPGSERTAKWVFDFVPDLHTGVWVAGGGQGWIFKFDRPAERGGVLLAKGCELRAGRAPQAAELVVSLSNFRQAAAAGGAAVPGLKPRTRIARLVTGTGEAFAGEFLGVSVMLLRTPQGVLRLERRNQQVAC